MRRTGKGEYGRLKFLTCDWRREEDGRPRIRVKFGGRKCNKLRFGARVEGVWPRVELSGAWSGWFKGSREINEKPGRQQEGAAKKSRLEIGIFNRNKSTA